MNRAASKKPSPRFASVLMDTQTARATRRCLQLRAVAWVACTRHQRSSSRPCQQQLDGAPPGVRHARLHLLDLFGDVNVQRSAGSMLRNAAAASRSTGSGTARRL